MQDVQINEGMFYSEELLQILEVGEHRFRNKVILVVEVWWQHHVIKETTWELEQEMRQYYSQLFNIFLGKFI